MSPVDPVSSSSAAPEASSTQTPTDASAPVAEGQIDPNASFSSMSNLSQMSPEVAQALAQGIAMNIVRMMKRAAKRMKNVMRTGTPDGSGPPVNR